MINGKKVFAVIMAAGKGTRIGANNRPKVMFEVAGKPIIGWAIEPFEKLKEEGLVDRVITVVGYLGDQIIDYLDDKSEFVWQKTQLGTAHAVMQAEEMIANEEGLTLITNGDHALYSAKTFEKLIDKAKSSGATLTFATVVSNRFENYGRVVRNGKNRVVTIVEVPEATEEELKIKEKSPSIFVVDNVWLFKHLPKIKMSSVKGEYYVNVIVEMAIREGEKVETVEIQNINEAQGINTEEDQRLVEKVLFERSTMDS